MIRFPSFFCLFRKKVVPLRAYPNKNYKSYVYEETFYYFNSLGVFYGTIGYSPKQTSFAQ